jgi:carboxyl-terminal processing protease
MKNRFLYGILVAALSINLLAGFQIYVYSADAQGKDDPEASLALLTQVMELIRQDYVDSDKVSYENLINEALRGMVGTLDPHSEFMPPRKFEELRDDTEGQFGGLGIVVSMRNEVLTVVAPMEDTPGYRAGILAGDKIIRIDGRSTENLTMSDAVAKLRGLPGTEVTITIMRDVLEEPKDFTIERAVIKVATVKDYNGRGISNKNAFPLDEDKIGYVRITQFGERTNDDLREALRRLKKAGMKSLVLDLRSNPGGLLDQAVSVCENFIPRGKLILTTEGRRESQVSSYHSRGSDRNKYTDIKIAVLVNGGSASASEIVAGCLQDATGEGYCDAIIVGEQTFGKGSVQSILPLEGGGALRLTTAKYYTPSHKVIHERGIEPDIEVVLTRDQSEALFWKRQAGGLDSLDDEARRERLSKLKDAQFERAKDMLKGISLLLNRETDEPERQLAAESEGGQKAETEEETTATAPNDEE